MKLEHVALNVPDPQAAAAWYVEHLGFEVVRANQQAPFEQFLSDGSGAMLEFYHNPAGAVPGYREMSPFTLHLALRVDDIAPVRSQLLAAGASAEGEIATVPSGDQLAFLRDPWGVPLQLVRRAVPLGG